MSTSEIEEYFDRLWPILRSITGEGVRKTLDILSEIVPMEVHSVPSGTKVFDWTVPDEWVVHEAYLEDPDGKRVLDVNDHNLHLLNYSEPFQGSISREELDPHLHSIPEKPDAVPYVTSYYDRNWGFCLSHKTREQLPDGEYEVVIDTEFKEDGALHYGEAILEGESDQEILISTNVCHPSMANNELSGPLVSAFLYQTLENDFDPYYTYRFVYVPETIGSLAFLKRKGEYLNEHLYSGFTLTCVGDDHPITYKESRQGDSVTDRAAKCVLRDHEERHSIQSFHPLGSDERQYCSPGFNLPVGCIMRSPPGSFPEYHTSLDNKDLISFDAIQETIETCRNIIQVLEKNRTCMNQKPQGEPFLTKYDLYSTIGGKRQHSNFKKAVMWVLNMSDGTRDLLEIARESGLAFNVLSLAAQECEKAGLLKPNVSSNCSTGS